VPNWNSCFLVAAALTRHECADILMQARHLFVYIICLSVSSAYVYKKLHLYFGCQMMTRPTLDHQFSLVVEITNSTSRGNKNKTITKGSQMCTKFSGFLGLTPRKRRPRRAKISSFQWLKNADKFVCWNEMFDGPAYSIARWLVLASLDARWTAQMERGWDGGGCA